MHDHDHHDSCCDACAQGKPCEGCDGAGGCGNAGCGCIQNDPCVAPTRDWQCSHPNPVPGGPSPRNATPPPPGIAWGFAGAPLSPQQASSLQSVLRSHGYAAAQAGPTSRRRQPAAMVAAGYQGGFAGQGLIQKYVQLSEGSSRPNQFRVVAPRATIRAAHARRGAKIASGYQGGFAGAVRYAVKDHAKGRDIYKEVEGRWLYIGSSKRKGSSVAGNGFAGAARLQVGNGCYSGCYTGPASRQRWGGQLRGRVIREYTCDPCLETGPRDPRRPECPPADGCPQCPPQVECPTCPIAEPCPTCPPGMLLDTMTGACVPLPVCPECPEEVPPELPPPPIDVRPPCCGVVFIDGRAFIECEQGSDVWGIPPEWHGREVSYITSDTRADGVKVVSVEAAFIPGGGARLPLCAGSEPPARPDPRRPTPMPLQPRVPARPEQPPAPGNSCYEKVLSMGYVPGTPEFVQMVARCEGAPAPRIPTRPTPMPLQPQVVPPQVGPTPRRPMRVMDRPRPTPPTPTPPSGNGSPSRPPTPGGGGGSWSWSGEWSGEWDGSWGGSVP